MTVPLSFSGKAQATYLASPITDPAATSFTVVSASTWTETVPVGGPNYGQPLGTSGPFVLTLDYGLSTEEKVLCTAVNTSTGLVTGVTRAYDGTTAQTHNAAAANPVIHTYSADTPYAASVALPKAGGTMSGAIAMSSNKITGLAAGTTTTDATNYTQLSAVSTTANGPQLTSTTPYYPTTGTPSANPLKTYSFTTTFTTSGGLGTGTITYPIAFANAVMGVTVTACYTGSAPTLRYCMVDYTGSQSLTGTTIYGFTSSGALVVNGTYRINVTVSGY